jgi:hypothetical protein
MPLTALPLWQMRVCFVSRVAANRAKPPILMGEKNCRKFASALSIWKSRAQPCVEDFDLGEFLS